MNPKSQLQVRQQALRTPFCIISWYPLSNLWHFGEPILSPQEAHPPKRPDLKAGGAALPRLLEVLFPHLCSLGTSPATKESWIILGTHHVVSWTNFLHVYAAWWLTYPSEKYDFVIWDDDIPNRWKNRKCSKPPTRMCQSILLPKNWCIWRINIDSTMKTYPCFVFLCWNYHLPTPMTARVYVNLLGGNTLW